MEEFITIKIRGKVKKMLDEMFPEDLSYSDQIELLIRCLPEVSKRRLKLVQKVSSTNKLSTKESILTILNHVDNIKDIRKATEKLREAKEAIYSLNKELEVEKSQ